MAKIITLGKEPLLESFGYNFRYKAVKLSQIDVKTLKFAIVVLDKAADLEAQILGHDDASRPDLGDNQYRIAELELRAVLEEE